MIEGWDGRKWKPVIQQLVRSVEEFEPPTDLLHVLGAWDYPAARWVLKVGKRPIDYGPETPVYPLPEAEGP